MHGFVASQLLLRSAKANRYVDILCRHYGAAAIEALDRSGATLNGRHRRYDLWGTEQGQAFPLLEPFLEKAEAVVVHSRFAAEIVAALSDAPQLELFLPSDKKASPTKAEPSGDGRVRFSSRPHSSQQAGAGGDGGFRFVEPVADEGEACALPEARSAASSSTSWSNSLERVSFSTSSSSNSMFPRKG